MPDGDGDANTAAMICTIVREELEKMTRAA
jgi:hypothetical protein